MNRNARGLRRPPRLGPAVPAPSGEAIRRAWRRSRGGPDPATAARLTKLARLEAALFCADRPLSPKALADAARLADGAEVKDLLGDLDARHAAANTAFRVERVARGYRLATRRRYADWLDRLHGRPARGRLSPPVLETLTVVAYRQPCTRADVDGVRGVQSADLLKQLLDRGLVRIAGEEQSLGRPFLYATTPKFLELFGLRSLKELPELDGS